MKDIGELYYNSVKEIFFFLLNIFRRLMVEKRKSVSKCPYWCRRNRTSTPDLLFLYLLGPELFVSPTMLTFQTSPVYLTARFGSSLSSMSSFIPGCSSFANPMVSFDSNLVPSSSGQLHTESSVVTDLSLRSMTQSVFPPQMDWYGPSGPSTSYMAPVQSDSMISISSNPYSSIQRFFQDFKLPDYTLDSFSGRLLDVVSSTTFSSSDAQTELCHAITRFLIFCMCIKILISFIRLFCLWISEFYLYFPFIYIDCLIYMNQEYVILLIVKPAWVMCHFH